MKYIISESQLRKVIKEQKTPNLTVPEQTLLGFLNRFLQGEKGEFENTPVNDLKKTMLFNSKTIYPMAQKLLEKKNTGKKTYDDKTFILLELKQLSLLLRKNLVIFHLKRSKLGVFLTIVKTLNYSWIWCILEIMICQYFHILMTLIT